MTSNKDIAVLRIYGPGVGYKPGIIGRLGHTLSMKGINIYSILTSQTCINLLVITPLPAQNIFTKEPMLVHPSLHYQNGGIEINDKCETNIKGLYVAGEASGGVHGRNRLMGNSVLDYNVFGRRAGKYAAEYVKSAALGKLTLRHITAYETEMKRARIKTDRIAPVLLPSYTPEVVCRRQLTAHYEGSLR